MNNKVIWPRLRKEDQQSSLQGTERKVEMGRPSRSWVDKGLGEGRGKLSSPVQVWACAVALRPEASWCIRSWEWNLYLLCEIVSNKTALLYYVTIWMNKLALIRKHKTIVLFSPSSSNVLSQCDPFATADLNSDTSQSFFCSSESQEEFHLSY